jgi:hypothetical protein
MSERDPHDLGELDPEQFVGDAPAGDATPGEFTSGDQSAAPSSDEDAGGDTQPQEDT